MSLCSPPAPSPTRKRTRPDPREWRELTPDVWYFFDFQQHKSLRGSSGKPKPLVVCHNFPARKRWWWWWWRWFSEEYFGKLCPARFHDTWQTFSPFSNHHFISPQLDVNNEMTTSSIRLKNLIKKQLFHLPLWILLAYFQGWIQKFLRGGLENFRRFRCGWQALQAQASRGTGATPLGRLFPFYLPAT